MSPFSPNRRQFATASAGMLIAPSILSADDSTERKRVAFLGTEVRRHSHAQHFLDRLTAGYTFGGMWQKPRVEVASVFIDQFPEGDLGRQRIARHSLSQYPSVSDALTLGTSNLAVDGVVVIAEHGDYPKNEKGQRLYPRYKWFKEIVKVFEDSGRSVPVFNDKHLSTNWDESVEMVEDSKRLGFEFLAGSSLPVTWRIPSIEMPYDSRLTESVCVAYGGIDSYDFHALETAQCMSERRIGGEVGIKSVHAARDEKLWEILEANDRELTRRLIVSALTRSHNLPVEGGFPTSSVTYEWFKRTMPSTVGYAVEHNDGFRTTILLLSGKRDFNYAGYIADKDQILSCQMYLPMPSHGSTTADFFNPLVRHIEDLVMNNKASYPVERTLLTSGMVIGGVDSLHQGQTRIETPQMDVKYRAPRESNFWRV